jgi:hypothetical protein
MTRKTDGEKIDELQILVATLIARLDYTRNEMIDRAEFAVVQDRLNELKRNIEETAKRRWSIWPAIVGALIGSVLAFLGQITIKHFMP